MANDRMEDLLQNIGRGDSITNDKDAIYKRDESKRLSEYQNQINEL